MGLKPTTHRTRRGTRRTAEAVVPQAECKLKKAAANLCGTISRFEEKERKRAQCARKVKERRAGKKVAATGAERMGCHFQHARASTSVAGKRIASRVHYRVG